MEGVIYCTDCRFVISGYIYKIDNLPFSSCLFYVCTNLTITCIISVAWTNEEKVLLSIFLQFLIKKVSKM